jgi:hypothetical protein
VVISAYDDDVRNKQQSFRQMSPQRGSFRGCAASLESSAPSGLRFDMARLMHLTARTRN